MKNNKAEIKALTFFQGNGSFLMETVCLNFLSLVIQMYCQIMRTKRTNLKNHHQQQTTSILPCQQLVKIKERMKSWPSEMQ